MLAVCKEFKCYLLKKKKENSKKNNRVKYLLCTRLVAYSNPPLGGETNRKALCKRCFKIWTKLTKSLPWELVRASPSNCIRRFGLPVAAAGRPISSWHEPTTGGIYWLTRRKLSENPASGRVGSGLTWHHKDLVTSSPSPGPASLHAGFSLRCCVSFLG